MKRLQAHFLAVSLFAGCGASEPVYSRPVEPLAVPYHDPEPTPQRELSLVEKVRLIAPQYGLEPEWMLAVGDKESGLKRNQKPVLEPTLIDDAVKALPDTATVKEVKALASSYCPFQITGLTARARNVHYSEIDEWMCVELAAVELAKWKEIRKGDKLMAAASYNGGTYPPEKSKAYARDVLSRERKFRK